MIVSSETWSWIKRKIFRMNMNNESKLSAKGLIVLSFLIQFIDALVYRDRTTSQDDEFRRRRYRVPIIF